MTRTARPAIYWIIGIIALFLYGSAASTEPDAPPPAARKLEMQPIGVIHKENTAAWIEIDRQFHDGLLGIGDFSHVWVFWWFDRNDTPAKRATLQVHPRGNRRNPLTGVFATRSPARPNLIALSLCRIQRLEGTVLYLEGIEAFDGTPVVDLKPYLPELDRAENIRLPDWVRRGE